LTSDHSEKNLYNLFLFIRVSWGDESREIQNLILRNSDIEINMTHGKVVLIVKKMRDRELIKKIVELFVKVCPTIHHEIEVTCSFEEIQRISSKGYKLVSYARKGDKYRAFFLAPFSERHVMDDFIRCMIRDYEETEIVVREFYWNVDERALFRLKDNLLDLGEWESEEQWKESE